MKRRTMWPLVVSIILALGAQPHTFADVSGGLQGIVVDKERTPIPGATVVAVNTAQGLSRGVLSDPGGRYRIVPLPPGRGYTLNVSFPGMATVEMSDIDLPPGKVPSIVITLVPQEDVRQHIRVVYHHDAVDPDEATTQTRFTAEFLEALPILGRDYQDVLALAPGVSDVDHTGNPNIHGARDTDVVTLVDGVSTVDPLTGKIGQQLNIESIQEIEVKTSGASAEFGRAQGGFVNIVTKSGGNDFGGSFKFFVRSDRIDGDGHGTDSPRLHGGLGGDRPSFKDLRPFLSLGGALKKDQAWYFVTGEYVRIEEPVNATTQQFVRSTDEKRVFAKLTWDVVASHKLSLSLAMDPQEYGNLGVDSRTLVESGYKSRVGGTNLVLKETAIFNPNVFLETTFQEFNARPTVTPSLDPDTNGNGVLYADRNGDGFIDPTERDPGEDWDQDGAWDVFEDVSHVGAFDFKKDRDADGHITGQDGCEGATREDQDCDGFLDAVNEDKNGNGVLDPGEDRDGDRHLDRGDEDRNFNRRLDDRPFPDPGDRIGGTLSDGTPVELPPYYPYEHLRPTPPDCDYTIDFRRGTIGPYYQSIDGRLGRFTLRQDLTIFIPDGRGQHDLKVGGAVERETYGQDTELRPIRIPQGRQPNQDPRIAVQLASAARNTAAGLNLGVYVTDTYKPLPNLALGLGVRFDREATESFGYTPFDPVAERHLYDRLRSLGPGEVPGYDATLGNGDGILSPGYCSDPIFTMPSFDCATNNFGNPVVADLASLRQIATRRLTQSHALTSFGGASLLRLYPEASFVDPSTGQIVVNIEVLRRSATFQEKERFRLTNNNLSPRLFLSWDPWSDSKTKIFLDWGRYYDKLFLDSVVREEGPDSVWRYYFQDGDAVTATGAPDNGFGRLISAAPPSITQVDRSLQTPFSDELTAGFEREIAPEVALRVTYINRKYRMQLQDRDINHSLRYGPDGTPVDLFGRYTPSGLPIADGRPDLYVENFFFNQIFRVANFNEARYTGIEVELRKRLSRKWQMAASYTYSRAIGAAEAYLSELGDDPSTVQNEFGYLDYDQRHVVKFNAAAYLPGDWQIGTVASWASGLPFSIVDRFFAPDNLDYSQYRTFFGYVPDDRSGFRFVRRNSQRNRAVFNINVRAQKALVLGRLDSKLFVSVENLLNTDDLRIFSLDKNTDLNTTLDSERRFGRRFELGCQFDF
jgi:carboxypeptidase family protein/TonB-dependent receptor-like protein